MDHETFRIIIACLNLLVNLFNFCMLLRIVRQQKELDKQLQKRMEDFEKIKRGEIDNLNFEYKLED